MSKKVLCIECGLSEVKIVEASYNKKEDKPTLHNIITVPYTHEGIINATTVFDEELLAFTIRKALTEANIKTNNAVFVINSAAIHARKITIPKQRSSVEVVELIKEINERDHIFPVDLTNYVLSYTPLAEYTKESEEVKEELEETSQEDEQIKPKKKKSKVVTYQDVMAYVAPRDYVKSFLEVGRIAKLKVVSVEYLGNSVYNFIKSGVTEDDYLTVQITDVNCIVTAIKDGVIAMQRTMDYSYNSFAKPLIERSNLFGCKTIDDVFNYMNHSNFLAMSDVDIDNLNISSLDKDDFERVKNDVVDLFFSLFNQVNSFISTYRKEYNRNIDRIFFVSEKDNFPDVVESIEANVKVATECYKVMGYDSFDEVTLISALGCIGANIAPVHFNVLDSEFERNKQVANKVALWSTMGTAGVIAIISALSVFNYTSTVVKNQKLQSDINNAIEAQQVYNKYASSLDNLTSITEFDSSCTTILNDLPDIFNDLEAVIPTNVTITAMGISLESITLSVDATDKDEIAFLVENLEKLDWFKQFDDEGNRISLGIELNNVTDTYNDGDSPRTVSTTIICHFKDTYVEVQEDVPVDGTEEATTVESTETAE